MAELSDREASCINHHVLVWHISNSFIYVMFFKRGRENTNLEWFWTYSVHIYVVTCTNYCVYNSTGCRLFHWHLLYMCIYALSPVPLCVPICSIVCPNIPICPNTSTGTCVVCQWVMLLHYTNNLLIMSDIRTLPSARFSSYWYIFRQGYATAI